MKSSFFIQNSKRDSEHWWMFLLKLKCVFRKKMENVFHKKKKNKTIMVINQTMWKNSIALLFLFQMVFWWKNKELNNFFVGNISNYATNFMVLCTLLWLFLSGNVYLLTTELFSTFSSFLNTLSIIIYSQLSLTTIFIISTNYDIKTQFGNVSWSKFNK